MTLQDKDCLCCGGTGMGYSHEPRSCGACRGRGSLLHTIDEQAEPENESTEKD